MSLGSEIQIVVESYLHEFYNIYVYFFGNFKAKNN